MTADASALCDEKTVAKHLGVHQRTVRRWRRDGLIAFYRMPTGRVRYQLDDALNAMSRQPPATE